MFNQRGEWTKIEITDKRLRIALTNLLYKALDEKFDDDSSGEAKKMAVEQLMQGLEYGDGFDTVNKIIESYQ